MNTFVCCAAASLLNMSLRQGVSQGLCRERCTGICYGYGHSASLPCVGCSTAPHAPPARGCADGFTEIRSYVNKSATAPQSYQVTGKSGDRGGVHVRFHNNPSGKYIVNATLESGTTVIGPGNLICGAEGHIRLGAGSTLINVTVAGCSDACPLHVVLPRTQESHRKKTVDTMHTRLQGVGVHTQGECAVIVEPVHLDKSHEAHGEVTITDLQIHYANTSALKSHYNVVVSNIDGFVNVNGKWDAALQEVLLFESTGGSTKLTLPAGTSVHNLSADLGIFSADYLIEYANDGGLMRGHEMKWLPKANNVLMYVAIISASTALLGAVEFTSVHSAGEGSDVPFLGKVAL